jgi:hypothetical protein
MAASANRLPVTGGFALRGVSPLTLLAAGLVAAVCAVPIVYLFIVILGEPAAAWQAIWRQGTLRLLLRSFIPKKLSLIDSRKCSHFGLNYT